MKTNDKLVKDRDSILVFYNFPVEHWQYLCTINPIDPTFAMLRHRTTRTRNSVSRQTFSELAFKMIEDVKEPWRKIHGFDKIELLLKDNLFKDGIKVSDNSSGQQKLAA